MTVRALKREDEAPYGFVADEASFSLLCDCLSKVPGVVFTSRRWFCWFSDQISAEFALRGTLFKVQPNSDYDFISVVPRNDEVTLTEIEEVRHHVELHLDDRQSLIQRLIEPFA
jgi:hypothetical protein